jgi:hypothetical protein
MNTTEIEILEREYEAATGYPMADLHTTRKPGKIPSFVNSQGDTIWNVAGNRGNQAINISLARRAANPDRISIVGYASSDVRGRAVSSCFVAQDFPLEEARALLRSYLAAGLRYR